MDSENGLNVSMPVAPMYGGYGGFPMMGGYGGWGNGFGGDFGSLLVLFIFAAMFGGGFGGFGGGWGGGFGGWGLGNEITFPWLLNGQNQINANTNSGFDHAATQNALGNLSTAVNTGFSNAEVSACNRAMADQALSFNNQIADLNRSFDAQTAITAGQTALASQLAQCCCDNRLATESLRATVLSENCEDRNQALLNTRDLLTAGTSNTQAILDAVRGINDKLCDQELQAERRANQELRTQVQMQNLAASQAAQTAALVADNNAQTATLIQRIAPYPVPAFQVGNPYGYNGYYGYNGWNGGCCGNNGFGFGVA